MNEKLASKNIPSNISLERVKWPLRRLSEVISIHYGKSLIEQKRIDGNIPIYGTNGITGWHNAALAYGPSIIIGRVGAGPLGVFWCEGPFWVIDCGYYTTFNYSEINAKFLYYFLKYTGVNHLKDGTSKPTLNRNLLGQQYFPNPPLLTQRKIAAILSAYDDLIENNLRRIKILEEMAQNLYTEWFVKFRFPGHEKVKMVDSPLGRIPEGWKITKLSNLVETQYGYTQSASETEIGPKFVRGMDINKTSYIDWSSVPYCTIADTDINRYRLKVEDILIIRMADPGKVGIVEKPINAIFASYLIRLHIVSPQLSPYYLFYFLCSDYYQGYITGASTGTTRKSASAGVITDVGTLVPDGESVKEFGRHVSSYRSMLNNLLNQNTILRHLRDLLLPRLISGELDVSGLDIRMGNDE